VNDNRKKIEAAAAKRREKQQRVRVASASSGWVKDKVTKKSHPIITDLQQYYIDSVGERNRTRDTEHIHPSEMSKSSWCQRQTLYRITDTTVDDDYERERLYWRLASIFEEGHEIHAKHQNAFWEMGTLYGMWECARCEHKWWALAPAVCESCASIHVEYREVPIRFPEYHLIGHTDGLHVDVEDPGDGPAEVYRNLEMKSVGIRSIEMEIPGVYQRWKESGAGLDALWSSIKIPFPSHQRQVQIYMATLRSMGFEVTETLFIYEFKANQDLKGFIVKYNERAAQKILEQARMIFEARESGSMIDRPDWATPKSKECKECPWKGRCWENDGVQDQET
jgi:hypothetical protein